jgi:N-acetylglucosamine-6-sulfatase
VSGGLSPREANNYLALIAALALIVGFGLTGSGPETSFAQTTDPRPNIVFVLTDDLRADDLRFMPRTRKLLAERGVRFSNAFTTRSLCCPSRATILRGQYAHNHLVWGNEYPLGSFYKFRELGHEGSTIATWLNDAGYDTVLTGKYLNKYDNTTYRPPGWDRWNAYLGTYYGDRYQINENGNIRTYHRSRFHDTDLLADKAAYFIRHPPTSSGAPFFMHLSPYAPHHPAHAARRHGGMFSDQPLPNTPAFNERDVSDKPEWVRDKPRLSPDAVRNTTQFYRQRLRALQSVGEMVGQLVDVLRETGELSNTYIVLTSDNGLHLGVHRLSEKSSAYEEAIRVPLLVRGPGVPRGITRPQLVLNNDLAPTFADLAGVTPTTPVDGRSLSPLLSATSPASWRTAFLVEHRSSTNEYPSVRAIPAYDAVRSADHLYVEYETGEKELYNLRRDPYELTSRHDSAPQTLLSELKGRLEALKVCTRADTSATSCKTAEDG